MTARASAHSIARVSRFVPILLDESSSGSVIFWSIILIIFLVLAFAGVAVMKKFMRDDDDEPGTAAAGGFTLSDLRRLHKAGELSDEEFAKAKEKIVEAALRAQQPPEPTPPRDPADFE